MKTICIDFDGVIHPNLVYLGSTIIKGEPTKGAKEALEKLSTDYEIVIHSARFHDMEAMEAVRIWLNDKGFDYELARFKPHAYIYLDDRGIQFKGDWDQSVEDIKSFNQWQTIQKKNIRKQLNKLHNRRII